MITIDGSEGEGGGQILRTSLTLSLVTGQPFRMERIRAKRQKPGLLRQHLTAVEAAKTVGCAEVAGAGMNSQTLEFRPEMVTPGNYRFAVGTAGSATLPVPLNRRICAVPPDLSGVEAAAVEAFVPRAGEPLRSSRTPQAVKDHEIRTTEATRRIRHIPVRFGKPLRPPHTSNEALFICASCVWHRPRH